MPHTSWFGSVAFAVLLLGPSEGIAATPLALSPDVEALDPTIAAAPVAEDLDTPLATAPVSDEPAFLSESELDEQRGGQNVVIANQTMQALTAGNSILGDSNAGAVDVSGNALSNFSGLGNIMINTGSQVNMQSGMNLTINVHP